MRLEGTVFEVELFFPPTQRIIHYGNDLHRGNRDSAALAIFAKHHFKRTNVGLMHKPARCWWGLPAILTRAIQALVLGFTHVPRVPDPLTPATGSTRPLRGHGCHAALGDDPAQAKTQLTHTKIHIKPTLRPAVSGFR